MTIQHVVEIAVNGTGTVSGITTLPEVPSSAAVPGVIVAHGAGNDREHPFIRSMADGLAHAGYPCLRFNFPYREEGRKSPDSAKNSWPPGGLSPTILPTTPFCRSTD